MFNQHSDLLNKNKYKDIPSYKHFKLSCEKLKMKLDVILGALIFKRSVRTRITGGGNDEKRDYNKYNTHLLFDDFRSG